MNSGTCSQLYYTVLAPAECICLYRSGVSILVTLYINAFTFRLTSKGCNCLSQLKDQMDRFTTCLR